MLCQYKNIFGIPGKGVHAWKFMDTAIFDYVGTLFLAVIFARLTGVPLVLSTILMFVLGVVLHVVFCVPTAAVKYLGLA